ncbi:hypothetical protein ACP70R_041028 [Stipagrostis hirtigluma subsp. patula]
MSWNNVRKITIGIVSPYSSQVNAIKTRLGTKYDHYGNFCVRVKSIDGFQGDEDDIIILSTIRSNSKGSIGFIADNQRTNVALTRARSDTIWAAVVHDAKEREYLFSATDDVELAKLIFNAKAELDQLGDLLNSDSVAFCNTKWKKLVGLGCGWRSRLKNTGMTDKFELAKVCRVSDLYLIWTTDLEKDGRFFQIIKIWDLVTLQHIERTIQRLENLFSMYSDNYMEHYKSVCKEGKWE